MKLKNKVAVITGSNSGIGLAIAKEFSAQGAKVVITGRRKDALDEAIKAIGDGALAVQGDVSNLADMERLYEQATARFGKIDIVVANAGIVAVQPANQVDEATFDKQVDINFKGVFFTVQKALPHLNDGASIILVSSVAHRKGFPGWSVYSATKAAVRSLARTLSAELVVSRGIRVNVLSPGPTDTPIFYKLGVPKEKLPKMAEALKSFIPLKRIGTPQEIAAVAVFLASSDSSFIVGEEIAADGGMVNL